MLKQALIDNLKNIAGWKTKRKLIVFAVDDYGNIRVDSKKALENLKNASLNVNNRFDTYDTLETTEDLQALYEALSSVKDKNGNHAVFTPFAVSCNINFEKMAKEGYQEYHYEQLPDTFSKTISRHPVAYEGVWKLWKEGMDKKLMWPEFHGREHFNLKVFNEKLKLRDKDLMVSLENHSLAALQSNNNHGWTAAFDFTTKEDTEAFPAILKTGLEAFNKSFGYQSNSFTPPVLQFPKHLEKELFQLGIRNLDKPFYRARYIGDGKYQKEINTMKLDPKTGLKIIVRNVVFEPSDGNIDHVAKALNQIKAAFHWNKPAIISSHRVNFCGHIDPKNRESGISELKNLLKKIVALWPDVEFISIQELGKIIK